MDLNNFFNSLTNEQKKQLANALLESSSSDEEENKQSEQHIIRSTKSPTSSTSVGEDFIVKKVDTPLQSRRKESVKARRNQWEDTGEFRDIHTPEVERTPRRREAPRKEEVECHVCGKPFKIDPRFSYGEYYRCNRCAGKK